METGTRHEDVEEVGVAPRDLLPPPARGEAEPFLPEPRWRELADHFEQRPRVLEGALPAPPVAPGELFATLVRAAEAHAAGAPAGFVLFLGAEVSEHLEGWLPAATDGGLEGYVERILRRTGGGDFTLLLSDPHLYGEEVWRAARRFTRGAARHLGMPCGGFDTGVFVGRYRKTPFGVHRGQMSVVTFPTVGSKRFLLWERGYGERHTALQDNLDYDDHRHTALELVADPGDVLYWPADFWHIAEGSESYTAAWNVGLWWDRPALARVVMGLGELLAAEDDGDDAEIWAVAETAEGGRVLPEALYQAVEQTGRAVAGGGLRRAVQAEWLRLLSADGFRDAPPPLGRRHAQVGEDELLESVPASRLLWSAEGDDLLLAANGQVLVLPRDLVGETVLARVAGGETLPVRALRDAGGGRLALPELLVAWRVLRRVPPQNGAGGAR